MSTPRGRSLQPQRVVKRSGPCPQVPTSPTTPAPTSPTPPDYLVDRIFVHMRFSKEIRGAWKTLELGAEASVPEGQDWRAAELHLRKVIGNRIKAAFSKKPRKS